MPASGALMPEPCLNIWARVLAESLSELLLGRQAHRYIAQAPLRQKRMAALPGHRQCGLYLPGSDYLWKQTLPDQ